MATAAFNEEYRNTTIALQMSGYSNAMMGYQCGADSGMANAAPKDSIAFIIGITMHTNGVWRPNQKSDAAAAKANSAWLPQ